MLRVELWRSTPFRLAITFGCVFVAAFVITGFITYLFLKRELLQELDDSIREIHTVVASTYSPNDLEDLISTVDTYSNLSKADERIFSVIDADGTKIAGNFSMANIPYGISDVSSEDIGLGGDIDFRVMAGPIGDKRLVVGQSLNETDRLEEIAFISFVWASILVIAGAVVGGVILATKAQQRLDGIASAMNAVSHGDLEVRVPLHGNGDDIDVVSRQINQALGRLSVLVETMRQVSADIAHELKTPLNRLKMQIEGAVTREERGETCGAALLDALDEVFQINATFEALLRISQIEAGARKTRFREVDLADIMLSVAEIYADVAEDNGQCLEAPINPSSNSIVQGDRELLTQMFVNLVENAIRHCPSGTKIEMGLVVGDQYAIATVCDGGHGIPASERDKVFRRLYRLDKSRTTTGSGLGLSLVRAIAELHGGVAVMKDNLPGLRAEVKLPLAER
ncbi:HAMP domain-containing histidine kinase [Rhizobium sp. KVB221]|uniref:histidine kinase n=1 Tax=Rhizobium setariae TaxID=2801340 RepID=A0A936YVS7_9HYPH|nr:HAMP domain-containing sensor histidine kinase [Rhizobium setariae]MBL0373995.1 HAMP domain-containing histidine kinase [Rhizobium setariae]